MTSRRRKPAKYCGWPTRRPGSRSTTHPVCTPGPLPCWSPRPENSIAEVRLRCHGLEGGATSPIALATLNARQGDEVWIGARGPQAAEAVTALASLIADGFGELARPPGPTVVTPTGPLGVSPGRVVGPARLMAAPLVDPPMESRLRTSQLPGEKNRLMAALEEVAADYEARADDSGDDAAQIMRATATLTRDPELLRSAQALMEALHVVPRRRCGEPPTTSWSGCTRRAAPRGTHHRHHRHPRPRRLPPDGSSHAGDPGVRGTFRAGGTGSGAIRHRIPRTGALPGHRHRGWWPHLPHLGPGPQHGHPAVVGSATHSRFPTGRGAGGRRIG